MKAGHLSAPDLDQNAGGLRYVQHLTSSTRTWITSVVAVACRVSDEDMAAEQLEAPGHDHNPVVPGAAKHIRRRSSGAAPERSRNGGRA